MAVILALVTFTIPRSEAVLSANEISAEAGMLKDGARYIDDNYNFQGYFTSTPQLTLPRGSYTVTLDIFCDTDHLNLIETQLISGSALYDEKQLVPPTDGELEFDLWVTSREAQLNIKTFYQFGVFSLSSVSVEQSRSLALCALALFVLLCASGDAVAYLFTAGCVKKGGAASRAAFFALTALILAASLPLLKSNMQGGHDISFHLMRIDGVADALRHGLLPARVYPFAVNGYGYASGLFYPDLFLYPSALLRLCGLPLLWSYKFIVLLANALSVICGYFGFKAIFKSRKCGVVGAALMTFASYRIVNVWLRAAAGEYLAMAFFPLVLTALWLLLREPTDSPAFKRGVTFGVIGFSGVIQSHIISLELIGLFTILFCALGIKRVLERKRLLALLKTAGLTLALNAWFLVPFLSSLGGDYVVNNPSSASMGERFLLTEQALFPSQLFALDGRCAGTSAKLSAGAEGEMPFGVGLLMFAAAAVFITALILRKGRMPFGRAGMLALGAAALLMFATTYLFPWQWVLGQPVIGRLAEVMQFPWRLLSLINLLLAFAGCAGFNALDKRAYRIGALAVLSAAAAIQLVFFFSAYTCDYRAFDTLAVGGKSVGNGEYLPAGCDINALKATAPTPKDVQITDYKKDGLSVSMTVANDSTAVGSAGLPELNYPGYRAVGSRGEPLELAEGENGTLAVEIPPDYHGSVEVSYVGRPLWRAGDALSLLALGCVIYCHYKEKKKPQISGVRGTA